MTLRVQIHKTERKRRHQYSSSTPPTTTWVPKRARAVCLFPSVRKRSLSLSLSEERRSLAKSRVQILIVLRKGVFALFAFVKHRLPFVCASQLHGVKPQHPMFALWTRLVYGCSRLLDVVVVPFVPYFRPVWVARFDVKFVQKAGGVRGRRLNRRRTVLLLLPFFPSATGAEHPLGRVRQRATRARNRRRRRAQVHRASTPRARRRHQSVGVQTPCVFFCRLFLSKPNFSFSL